MMSPLKFELHNSQTIEILSSLLTQSERARSKKIYKRINYSHQANCANYSIDFILWIKKLNTLQIADKSFTCNTFWLFEKKKNRLSENHKLAPDGRPGDWTSWWEGCTSVLFRMSQVNERVGMDLLAEASSTSSALNSLSAIIFEPEGWECERNSLSLSLITLTHGAFASPGRCVHFDWTINQTIKCNSESPEQYEMCLKQC